MHADSPDTVTPEELAVELGVDAKAIRSWLRSVEMRSETEKHARWQLSTEEANFVRTQFRR